jgi:hypothetical protein
LEHLEQRLPPGDTVLGLFAAEALLGYPSPELREPPIRVSAGALGLNGALAEVIPDEDVDDPAERTFIVQRARDGASPDLNSHRSELLEPLFTAPARVSSYPSGLNTSQTVELTTGASARVWSLQPPVNSISIHSLGETRIVLPSPAGLQIPVLSDGEGGYSTPFYIEKNVGQAGEGLDFIARGPGYTLGLSASEAVFVVQNSMSVGAQNAEFRNQNSETGVAARNSEFRNQNSEWGGLASGASRGLDAPYAPPSPLPLSREGRGEMCDISPGERGEMSPLSPGGRGDGGEGEIVRMHLLGGNPNAPVTGLDPLVTKVNYFLGNDPNQWHTNIPTFAKVHYDDVYPGIDLVYYSSQHSVVSSQHENPNLPPSPLGRGDGGEGTTTHQHRPPSPPGRGDGGEGTTTHHSPLTTHQHGPPSPLGRGDGGEGTTTHHSPLTAHQLEYDFIVAPGADPNQIRLSFSGADSVTLDADGNLILQAGDTQLRQQKPYIYQDINGTRQQVQGEFRIQNSEQNSESRIQNSEQNSESRIQNSEQNSESRIQNSESSRATDYCLLSTDYCLLTTDYSSADYSVSFEIGAYDKSRPLVIDPMVLSYSTYLGSANYDYAHDIAVDPYGNAYITGQAYSGFPLVNPAQGYAGSGDAFVAKLSPDGQTLLYSTYIGGSGEEAAFGVAVSAKGSAYVTGYTLSSNFPTTPGAFQRVNGHGTCPNEPYCADAFVTRLGPDGGSMIYSTYLGVAGPESADAIAVDSAGNAYIKGQTMHPNFPVVNAAQPTHGGGWCGDKGPCADAFVTKLNGTGSALVYSTFLGGSGEEGYFFGAGGDIAVDPFAHAYVTGYTYSANFPITPNAFQRRLRGVIDVYVAKLSPEGSAFVYATYLGGRTGGEEQGSGIAADTSGNAYVTGIAWSDDFPTTPESFKPNKTGGGVNPDAFVSKLDPNGFGLVYSTYLGGSTGDSAYDIAADKVGNAYVMGTTDSSDFPHLSAFQPGYGGGLYDVFVTKFAPGGRSLAFSSFLGGSALDVGAGLALDKAGNIYLTGHTDSSNLPMLRPFQAGNAGYRDGFVTKVSRFAREPVSP